MGWVLEGNCLSGACKLLSGAYSVERGLKYRYSGLFDSAGAVLEARSARLQRKIGVLIKAFRCFHGAGDSRPGGDDHAAGQQLVQKVFSLISL